MSIQSQAALPLEGCTFVSAWCARRVFMLIALSTPCLGAEAAAAAQASHAFCTFMNRSLCALQYGNHGHCLPALPGESRLADYAFSHRQETHILQILWLI